MVQFALVAAYIIARGAVSVFLLVVGHSSNCSG